MVRMYAAKQDMYIRIFLQTSITLCVCAPLLKTVSTFASSILRTYLLSLWTPTYVCMHIIHMYVCAGTYMHYNNSHITYSTYSACAYVIIDLCV